MINVTLRDEAYTLRVKDGRIMGRHLPQIRQMDITVPRGDIAGFQILVASGEAVAVCLSDAPQFASVVGAYRLRLTVESVLPTELFEVGMLPDDDGTLTADALLPSDSFEITNGMPRCVYCRTTVPLDAVPGQKKLTVRLYVSTMFEEECLLEQLLVNVNIASTALPEQGTFVLDLWQHSTNIARHHDVRLWSDEHFTVLEGYVQSLAALGQKSATIIASEIPWRGQSCYKYGENLFEYSMVQCAYSKEHGYSFDFSVMDRYTSLCEKHNIANEIEIFGIASVWIDEENGYGGPISGQPTLPRVRVYNENTGCYQWMDTVQDIELFVCALAQHLRDTNRMERVRIASDEPADVELYGKCIKWLQNLVPDFRFKTAINHAEFIEQFHESIDVFAPFIYCVSHEWDRFSFYRDTYKEKTFQWYLCCGPSELNSFLRCNLLESRFIGILTSFMQLDGFLRWSHTAWPASPARILGLAPLHLVI